MEKTLEALLAMEVSVTAEAVRAYVEDWNGQNVDRQVDVENLSEEWLLDHGELILKASQESSALAPTEAALPTRRKGKGKSQSQGGGAYESIGTEIEEICDEVRSQRDAYVEREASRIVGLVEEVPDLILERVREKLQGVGSSPARFRAGIRSELGNLLGPA